MTAQIRYNVTTTVNLANQASFERDLHRLLAAYGAKRQTETAGITRLYQSPELQELGLDGQLGDILVRNGIDNVRGLAVRTEDNILALQGLNFISVRRIRRALHRTGWALQGESVDGFSRSLDAVDFKRDQTYALLRQQGFRTLDDFGRIELPEARKRSWYDAVKSRIGYGLFRPTNLDRPVTDFTDRGTLIDLLPEAGLETGADVVRLRSGDLRRVLKPAMERARYDLGTLDYALQELTRIFGENGHHLRS